MSDSVKQKPVHAVRCAPSAAKPPKGIPVSSGRGGCQILEGPTFFLLFESKIEFTETRYE